jgi:hypothetical protein
MNTETTIPEADVTAADERLKEAVLRDLTPQALADHLLIAQGEDDPVEAAASAFKYLMKAADRLHCKRTLNGRTKDQLSDDEYEKLTESVSVEAIIRDLVDDYGAKYVCEVAKAAGEANGDD